MKIKKVKKFFIFKQLERVDLYRHHYNNYKALLYCWEIVSIYNK